MSYIPKAGDTVYSHDGAMALYVSTAKGGGYIVQPLIEDGDGISEPDGLYADGVDIWHSVYPKPPQPKLDAEIAAQVERLAGLRREIAESERLKRETTANQREVLERLKQHEALRYVDDMISGRMPPLCVEFPGYHPPKIVSTSDALRNPDFKRDYREPAFKLLTLFGDSKGDLQWRINAYRDGSGNWGEVVFVATEEEGIAVIRSRYALAVEEWRQKPADSKSHGDAIRWASDLPAGWIDVPQDVADYIATTKRKRAEEQAAKARDELAQAEAALAAIATA